MSAHPETIYKMMILPIRHRSLITGEVGGGVGGGGGVTGGNEKLDAKILLPPPP